jgi:putative Mn2+ efflux pump MntP
MPLLQQWVLVGATHQNESKTYFLKMALLVGFYFGVAQGVMPLMGYALGSTMLGWFADWASWIAFLSVLDACIGHQSGTWLGSWVEANGGLVEQVTHFMT